MIPPFLHLDANQQSRYRSRFLLTDSTQASVGMIFFSIFIIIKAFNDYQFFGFSTEFKLLIMIRAVAIICSILFVVFIRRIKQYRRYDKVIFVWQLLGLFTLIAINLTRPSGYYMFVISDVVIVSTIYIIFRSRFLTQTILAFCLTIADLSIILISKHVSDPGLLTVLLRFQCHPHGHNRRHKFRSLRCWDV